MNANQITHWLQVAETAARAAGERLRQAMGSELLINQADQHDLKIQLDVEIQSDLERALLSAFPGSSVLGEEGQTQGTSELEWIIDPIDGTVNFVYSIPHFCISIAACNRGEIVGGLVFDPMRQELFTAMRGGGAFLNGRPIRVSSRTQLSEAILAVGFSKGPDTIERALQLYAYYAPRVRKLRAMGSAALDMAYVASGRLDAYIEQGIKIWDIAAGMLLVQEAGGRVDLEAQSQPHHFRCCAANPHITFAER